MNNSNSRRIGWLVASHVGLGLIAYWSGSSSVTTQSTKPSSKAAFEVDSKQNREGDKSGALIDSHPATSQRSASRVTSVDPLVEHVSQLGEKMSTMTPDELLTELRATTQGKLTTKDSITRQLMLSRLARLDPQLALGYAESLTSQDRSASQQIALSSWTASDPIAASRYFSEHSEEFGIMNEAQRKAAATIASQWAQSDPQSALRWAKELPDEVRTDALVPLVSELSHQKPAEIINLLNTLPQGSDRSELIDALINSRAEQAPAQTADWIGGISDPVEREGAASSLIQTWAKTDVTAAANWARNLAPGSMRDNAVKSLLESPSLRTSPDLAADWAAFIQDDSIRDEALRLIAARREVWESTVRQ